MWAGSDKMDKPERKIKKLPAFLVGLIVLLPVVLITIDIELFKQMWRPEIGIYITAYGLVTHIIAIIGYGFLFIYFGQHIQKKGNRIFARIGLVIGVVITLLFMGGTIGTGSIKPVKTFHPEGYDHVYYMFPQQGWLTRRGYGIYAPVSDYTMEYQVGDVAMDFDTAYVSGNYFYIKFNGMSRMFRAESDHLYEFDLTKPQY